MKSIHFDFFQHPCFLTRHLATQASLLTNGEDEGTKPGGGAAEPGMERLVPVTHSTITIISEEEKEDPCETDSSSVGSDVSPPTPAGSMYLHGGLSDGEEERQVYDRPHRPVDMGGGDMVQCYE